jgi:hypothetical protein
MIGGDFCPGFVVDGLEWRMELVNKGVFYLPAGYWYWFAEYGWQPECNLMKSLDK